MSQLVFTAADRGPDGKLLVFAEAPADVPPGATGAIPSAEPVASRVDTPVATPAAVPDRPLRDLLPAEPDDGAATVRQSASPWVTFVMVVLVVLVGFALLAPRFAPAPATRVAPTVENVPPDATGAIPGHDPVVARPTTPPAPSDVVLAAAVVARWDYRVADSATPLDRGTRVVPLGQADNGAWLFVCPLAACPNGAGAVWLAASSVPDVRTAGLPDLTVQPTPVPQPVYNPPSVAVSAPAPVCGEYGVPGKMITACGPTQADADAAGQALWTQLYAR